jgi:hypothetical protein
MKGKRLERESNIKRERTLKREREREREGERGRGRERGLQKPIMPTQQKRNVNIISNNKYFSQKRDFSKKNFFFG